MLQVMKSRILLFLAIVFLISSCAKQIGPVGDNIEKDQTAQEEILVEDQKELFENKEEKKDSTDNAIKFDYPPTEVDKLLFIYPLGFMFGSHVTPVDHQYYVESSPTKQEGSLEVYSPAEGVITSIQHMSSLPGEEMSEIDDYRLVIEHTSIISTIYIHIDQLSEKIAKYSPPPNDYANVNIPVEAGEVIGMYGGSLDFNIVDKDIILTGFVIPESYEAEAWKIHVKDPFDYFNEPIKSQLIEKCLRTAEPVGGKIDYDIDGKLVGTWFKENTNKYGGLGSRFGAYYAGHLAIAYDYIDPEHIIVSFGSYKGESKQFGVKGNNPDPSDIGVGTLVKYELVYYDYFDGDIRWDRKSLVKGLKVKNSDEQIIGTVLFELIEDRILKMDIFDGKTAEEVDGFSENALTYKR